MPASEREQTIAWEMGQCRHFNGIQNERCAAGVAYRELCGDAPGWAKDMPCLLKGSIKCDLLSLKTREEAEKEADMWEHQINKTVGAINAAKSDAKSRGLKRGNGGRGEVKCPACPDGTLRYTVAGVNGHMHAKCTTEDCASWME